MIHAVSRIVARVSRMVRGFVRTRFCHHAFRLEDLHKTGIPEPEKPADGASYQAWKDYHRELTEGPHHTERVEWPCARCGKVFRAHCGLDISPEHGPILPSPNNGDSWALGPKKPPKLEGVSELLR